MTLVAGYRPPKEARTCLSHSANPVAAGDLATQGVRAWTAMALTQISTEFRFQYPGGRLNKKDGLTRYGNSHVEDKTS